MKKIIFILTIMLSCTAGCKNATIKNGDMNNKRMLIVAHRGGALLGNENSLSCFEKGISAGADIIELDIHMSKDGELIVCHDPTLDRTTDTEGRIEDMTLEEIKKARIIDFETEEPTDERIPTLSEAIEKIDGRAGLLIEIKRKREDQYAGIEAKLLEVINSYGIKDKCIVQSFDDQAIMTVNKLDPKVRVEKLIFCRLPFGLCFDGGITRFSFEKYSFCASINPMGALVGKRFVEKCHKAGFEVKAWTINKPSSLIEGLDGVITNRPDLF